MFTTFLIGTLAGSDEIKNIINTPAMELCDTLMEGYVPPNDEDEDAADSVESLEVVIEQSVMEEAVVEVVTPITKKKPSKKQTDH